MPKVVLKTQVGADADLIWRTVHGFSDVASWHPLVERAVEGEAGGAVRALEFAGLGTFVERLDERDDAARVVSYAVTDSPLPVEDCSVEIRVEDNGDGSSTIAWTGVFSAPNESEFAAVKSLHRIFHGGIERLEDMFGVVED